jgi:hypothetical protein
MLLVFWSIHRPGAHKLFSIYQCIEAQNLIFFSGNKMQVHGASVPITETSTRGITCVKVDKISSFTAASCTLQGRKWAV